jgi:hypothetical protein
MALTNVTKVKTLMEASLAAIPVCAIKFIMEEVIIPVGSGNTPTVVSTKNLAPANSLLVGIGLRITQAPGGGATTLEIGKTPLSDDLITGFVIAGVTGAFPFGGYTTTSAATFTLKTDADVTISAMKMKIVSYYAQITAPSA